MNAIADTTLVASAAAVQVAPAETTTPRSGVLISCTVANIRIGGSGTGGAVPDATHGAVIIFGQAPVFVPCGGDVVFAFSAGAAVVSVTEVGSSAVSLTRMT